MPFEIPETDEDLLAQCDVETFRAGGPGGQHQNTADTGVRLRHRPSGVVVTCREQRSQLRNKTTCLRRLRQRLEKLAEPVPERVPTKRPRAAEDRRLEEKRQRAGVKKARQPPTAEE